MSENDFLQLIASLIVQVVLNQNDECNRLCTHQ
jgi:hypothetical protein